MAPSVKEVVIFIGRSSKRIAVTAVGGAVVAGGLAMLVLPGPGILVVALGFAILGTEYAWAAVAFEKTKRGAEQAGRVAKVAVKTASGRVRRRRSQAGHRLPHPESDRSAGAGPPAGRRVLTDEAVHRLAEQIGVPGVPAVLLDQVADQPAKAGVAAVGPDTWTSWSSPPSARAASSRARDRSTAPSQNA